MFREAGEEEGRITMIGEVPDMIGPNEDVRPRQSELHQILCANQLARSRYSCVEITEIVLIKPNVLHQGVQRLLPARGAENISHDRELKTVACSSYPVSNVRVNEWQYFPGARGNLTAYDRTNWGQSTT